jgi:hypothetical protein
VFALTMNLCSIEDSLSPTLNPCFSGLVAS